MAGTATTHGHQPSRASWEVANQPRCQEHQHHLVFMGWENQPGTHLPGHRNRSASLFSPWLANEGAIFVRQMHNFSYCRFRIIDISKYMRIYQETCLHFWSMPQTAAAAHEQPNYCQIFSVGILEQDSFEVNFVRMFAVIYRSSF